MQLLWAIAVCELAARSASNIAGFEMFLSLHRVSVTELDFILWFARNISLPHDQSRFRSLGTPGISTSCASLFDFRISCERNWMVFSQQRDVRRAFAREEKATVSVCGWKREH